MTDQPIPDYLAALGDDDDDDPARVYLDSDDEARVCGAWREEADAGVRVAAYLVLSAALVVAGALVVTVAALLR